MVKKEDFLDNLSKVVTNALSSASGAKEDMGNFIRSKTEGLLNDFELVQREEFDALKTMVISQSEEIKKLKQKLNDQGTDA